MGYPTCALANEHDNTTEADLKRRTKNIINSLYHNPLPIVSSRPEVITYSDIKSVILIALYSPIQAFPFVANILAGIERGDGSVFAPLLQAYHSFQCENQEETEPSLVPFLRNKTGLGMSHAKRCPEIRCLVESR